MITRPSARSFGTSDSRRPFGWWASGMPLAGSKRSHCSRGSLYLLSSSRELVAAAVALSRKHLTEGRAAMRFVDCTWEKFKNTVTEQIHKRDNRFIYRGQSNSSWPLKTSIHRTGQWKTPEDIK